MSSDPIEQILGDPTRIAGRGITVGEAARVLKLAKEAFGKPQPISQWLQQCADPLALARAWTTCGWQDEAWAFMQLRYDQLFKSALRDGTNGDFGACLFDLSGIARLMNHTAAARHYTGLALAADLLVGLEDGAAGTYLAGYTNHRQSERFREKVRAIIQAHGWRSNGVVYPEALLASCWFGTARGAAVLELANPKVGQCFVDRVLGELKGGAISDNTKLGTLFEAAAGLVLAVTPGFEVRGAVDDPASQTDLLASYRTDAIVNASLPEGYALIECKYQERAVGSSLVRELGARCLIHGAKLGVLVVRERIAGDDNARNALAAAQLERRRLLPHGVHILVVSADDLREASRELRGLEPILREDYEVLCFGEPPATAGADSRQAAR